MDASHQNMPVLLSSRAMYYSLRNEQKCCMTPKCCSGRKKKILDLAFSPNPNKSSWGLYILFGRTYSNIFWIQGWNLYSGVHRDRMNAGGSEINQWQIIFIYFGLPSNPLIGVTLYIIPGHNLWRTHALGWISLKELLISNKKENSNTN